MNAANLFALPSRRRRRSGALPLTTTILALATASTASAIQLGVPSYEYRGDSAFGTLVSAGAKVGMVILDPGNGEINPNDGATYDSEALGPWATQSHQSHQSNTNVFCYVHSSYGARSLSLVEGDIDAYFAAGFTVDGIFIDEVGTSWSGTGSSYYAPLYAYIKTNHPGTLVAINPGSMPDGPNWMDYACDIVMDFESNYSDYHGIFAPSWVFAYPSNRFWNAVINTPNNAAAVDACFATAAANNVGYLYVTDLTVNVNTYGSLPAATIWSEELADATTSTTSGTPPDAPAGLTATGGIGKVSLSWQTVSDATWYNVYRGTSPGGEDARPVAAGLRSTSYTDTSVTNGTAYYYRVAAVNAGGTGAASTEASATPVAQFSGEKVWDDGTNFYCQLTYADPFAHFDIFLDTDNNPATGFTVNGIGADDLIEDTGLYVSTANGNSWSWAGSVYTVTETFPASGTVKFTVPLAVIGSPTTAKVVFQGDDASWNPTIDPTVVTYNKAQSLASVSIAPKSLTGGQSGTVTVTLTGPAPAGGTVVSLVSDSRDAAKVSPTSITVLEGETTATATVKAYPVAANTVVTLTAKALHSHTCHLTVLAPVVQKVQVLPTKIVGGAGPQTGTVTLSGPVAVDTTVQIASDNVDAIVPSYVLIHPGKSTATFTVKTKVVAAVETATITATGSTNASTCGITIKP